jgi:hypothetical protein
MKTKANGRRDLSVSFQADGKIGVSSYCDGETLSITAEPVTLVEWLPAWAAEQLREQAAALLDALALRDEPAR